MGSDVEWLVEAAKEGDRKALEDLILKIQNKIYGLALRMLYNPSNAEDAAQEILLKIITRLSTFRGESAFTTWMYRVAVNHLLTLRRNQPELEAVSFEEYEKSLELDSPIDWQESRSSALQNIYVEEIMISCLQGLLLCLDRDHRLAFLLVEVFDVSSDQGSAILEITPTAFRKRLSRARERIQDFLMRNCALLNPDNPCTCERYVISQHYMERVEEKDLVFAKHPCRIRPEGGTVNRIREMDELSQMAALYKRYPDFQAPTAFIDNLRDLVHSKKFELL
ncbi:MAG: RNA polymerase sigma factor [Deltaproteobacteria bacterium]|nr:RNA polymerase sigma factor [Deltaproteobacteria bacterium]